VKAVLQHVTLYSFWHDSVADFFVRMVWLVIFFIQFHYVSSTYLLLLTYDVIFWGNSAYSTKIFRIQKKIIRIMSNLRSRDSCRNTFKTMKILPFYSQYIFSVLIYIINNRHLFTTNQEVHNLNTRSNLKFHVPGANLTKFQKGV
jgi:hypothetical protein